MRSRKTHNRIASRDLYEQIQANPELAAPFSPEDIEKLRQGKTPKNFTWHHHQDEGVMQLVDQAIHEKTWHKGGVSIWGR